MSGFFVVYRELFDKPIWLNSTPEQIKVLILIIGLANHTGKKWEWEGQQFTCERGQFITSLPRLVAQCGKGVSTQNVRTALKRFEKLEFLTDKATPQGRLITICNYRDYQDIKNEDNTQTNRQLTDDQQTPNRHLTPTNNVNNVNHVNNEIPKPKKTASKKSFDRDLILSDQWKDLALNYWSEKNRNDLDVNDQFFQFKKHHMANATKSADWQSSWSTWYANAVKFNKAPFQVVQINTPASTPRREMIKAGTER